MLPMNRLSVALFAGMLAGSAASAADLTVPNSAGLPGAPWLGFMNVSELSGTYVFGSPWGVPDLRCIFDDTAQTLTMTPNSINDPNPFWYTPAGGPGSTGNKRMDAVVYSQQTSTLGGQLVTFSGTVISNTLTSAHTANIFIRDFAPDFSSFNEVAVPATPGPFSLTVGTDPTPGRHVQIGVQMVGPCVWITDLPQAGQVVIATTSDAPECNSIDFNGDGLFPDDSDLLDFLSVLAGGACSTESCQGIDFNNDGLFPDDSDLIAFLRVLAGGDC
jgi:hypothetical protein